MRRLTVLTVVLVQCLPFTFTRALAAPTIIEVGPIPGIVHELPWITVTFNESVSGIYPGDLLLNGIPATGLSGGAATYTFYFPQPPFGPVDVTWAPLHTIVGLDNVRFDGGASGSTWAYQLVNPAGPGLSSIVPMPGTRLRWLNEVEVSFSQPVTGVSASDLLLNGVAATNVTGVGAGPYRFAFPAVRPGLANVQWSRNQGIIADDMEPTPFVGLPWSYTVDPAQPAPDVVINEIVAENQTGLLDEDKDPEDWIELFNRGPQPVNLGGWSLSVDREEEGQWVFPSTILPAGGYLLVWASGKDRREPAPGRSNHTNFKLNPSGDTLSLFGPELPRTLVDQLAYPEQSPNHAYGRQPDRDHADWRFMAEPTPAAVNSFSTITGKVDEVHFSVERGFFNAPFNLTLACRSSGAEIRYTLDGSPPGLTNGFTYAAPIPVTVTRVVRAAAFAPQQLPSRVRTHTYLMNLANNRRLLPVLSLVTATNNLYGRTGIMESNPRNTTKHGSAWERPVSAEWIRPEDNGGFQMDAGLRVAGGDYIRQRYNYRQVSPPEGKYSFRLYFRGDYGPGRLEYPVFASSTLDSYNTLHLRAGMNDPGNPFLKDEFVRELSLDMGITACHGTFVYLFLNGVYKGLYNPCERVDDDFLQAYHGGGELWDVIGPGNQVIRGDATAWNRLRTAVRKDLTLSSNYLEVAAQMDLTNFIDYLLPLIWADDDDWPHNNTRAAREKKVGAKFRFYPWDAEFAFSSHGVSYDTIARTLSSMSPPWGTTDYQAMFNSLKKSAEFQLLFADRVHRAFFNDGPLTDARMRAHYNAVKAQVAPSISGFSDLIGNWISNRRRYVTNFFDKAGFLASSTAPIPSQFGGYVPAGYQLTLQNSAGAIFYTTNGTDPRVAFTSMPSQDALRYAAPLLLTQPLRLLARSLDGTNWSAIVDVTFDVQQRGNPLRITELMYDPAGGDAFEYIELENTGVLPMDLSGYTFEGIQFRFPAPFPPLAPGGRLVLANDASPDAFQRRYPGLVVAGWFAGSLANHGERITLLDSDGRAITAVEYSDRAPWPVATENSGSSLEISDPQGDLSDPSNWHASHPGGSPGQANSALVPGPIQINEVQTGSGGDWIELYNPGSTPVDLASWSITDNSDPRQFVFPTGTSLPAGGFIQLSCHEGGAGAGLTAPFQLDRRGETVALFDPNGARMDVLRFGPVVDGYTVGRVNGRLALCRPTPSQANAPVELGPVSGIRINEFMAHPDAGDDWIEFHNSGALPVSLEGCFVVTSNALARMGRAVFIAPGGVVALAADKQPGPDHLDLKVPAEGGWISLLTPHGQELDHVIYGAQRPGISLGRLPNGSGTFQEFPLSPTRGAANYQVELGTTIRIAEFLARSSPEPDWVELENSSTLPASLAGFTFCVKAPGEPEVCWPFPAGAQLQPAERLLLYCGNAPSGFVALPNSYSLPTPLPDSRAVLNLRDALGRLRDQVEYGPQLVNRSVGRFYPGWKLLAARSPGQPNGMAAPLATGESLRLNEWLASSEGIDDFIEVYNSASLPVSLEGWVLTDDPSIRGATNWRLAPLTFVEAQGFLPFHPDGHADHGADYLPFRLNRYGETIRLLNPSGQIIDTADFSVQREGVSEGRYPDGAAQLVRFVGSVSAGLANYLLPQDGDGDRLEDSWELLHGLDPLNTADAQLDPDSDGFSNLAEFLSGTDPQNASSLLRLEISGAVSGELTLRFNAQPGLRYAIESCDTLSSPVWHLVSEVPAGNAARQVEAADPTPQSQRATRFYRVVIPQ